MVKKRGNFTGRAGRIGEQWNVIIEERGGGRRYSWKIRQKILQFFSARFSSRWKSRRMEWRESQGCSLSIVFSRRSPLGVVKSIINSSAEKGARIQRIPSLTPPNSFSATGAPSQGVERGLGRESQVAATINQISSKLSRLFDRHHSLLASWSTPESLSCSALSGTIGPRVNWKKEKEKKEKKKKKREKGEKRWRKWVFEADQLFQWLKVAASRREGR